MSMDVPAMSHHVLMIRLHRCSMFVHVVPPCVDQASKIAGVYTTPPKVDWLRGAATCCQQAGIVSR